MKRTGGAGKQGPHLGERPQAEAVGAAVLELLRGDELTAGESALLDAFRASGAIEPQLKDPDAVRALRLSARLLWDACCIEGAPKGEFTSEVRERVRRADRAHARFAETNEVGKVAVDLCRALESGARIWEDRAAAVRTARSYLPPGLVLEDADLLDAMEPWARGPGRLRKGERSRFAVASDLLKNVARLTIDPDVLAKQWDKQTRLEKRGLIREEQSKVRRRP